MHVVENERREEKRNVSLKVTEKEREVIGSKKIIVVFTQNRKTDDMIRKIADLDCGGRDIELRVPAGDGQYS